MYLVPTGWSRINFAAEFLSRCKVNSEPPCVIHVGCCTLVSYLSVASDYPLFLLYHLSSVVLIIHMYHSCSVANNQLAGPWSCWYSIFILKALQLSTLDAWGLHNSYDNNNSTIDVEVVLMSKCYCFDSRGQHRLVVPSHHGFKQVI